MRWPVTGNCRRSWPGSPTQGGPTNATFLVAVVSLVLGLVHGVPTTTGSPCSRSLINFGAMTAFLALHVSVVVHYLSAGGSRDWLRTWSRR